MRRTLFEKLWDAHTIEDLGGGWSLLHVDRNLMHDLSGSDAFRNIRARGIPVLNPELVIATPDHAVSSVPGRTAQSSDIGGPLHDELRRGTTEARIRLLDIGSGAQGIVHVIGPELGLVLPGLSVACGDSHTCTNGALGALAIGVGSSEVAHVLATQTLRLKRPLHMRVRMEGRPSRGVTPKDMVLHAIRTLGTAAGAGHAVEFAGQAIREMSIEGRLTVCNMAVEMGARFGVIAPDQRTFDYVRGRPCSPCGVVLEQAIESWKQLASDFEARFDKDVTIDVAGIAPTVTWGTSPEQAIAVNDALPKLQDFSDPDKRAAARAAFDYMGLEPGRPIAGTPVDWVFIGSCNNSRLSDLEAAAIVVEGRKVAKDVRAWVVPGSETVQREAEQAGLDKVFTEAGFEWRDAGCSMCAAANGEQVPPGARCISTSNRNFVGRQGPCARTHLSSPAMAAAAAIAGAIVDVREFA
jgi:3-isopropylmalate/(R)-2-methylmalate dehydratase large subunit